MSASVAGVTATPQLVTPAAQNIQQQVVLQSTPQAIVSTPRTTVAPSTPTSAAATKYAVTPQVVQQGKFFCVYLLLFVGRI